MKKKVALVGPIAGRVAALFAQADIVSEGRVTAAVYEGSTSVVLRPDPSSANGPDLRTLAELVGLDPHARILALRVAHREAWARAGSPLATIRAELSVTPRTDGVALTLDVVAALAGRGTLASGA